MPFLGVNHLEGHLLSCLLEDPAPTFPFLALVVSGGLAEAGQTHRAFSWLRDTRLGELGLRAAEPSRLLLKFGALRGLQEDPEQ